MPSRSCLKIGAPGESMVIISAMIIIGIAKISRPKKEHTMSKTRFVTRNSFFCRSTGFAI